MPAKMRPIIMCGGAGTRLRPTSRNSLPKQFAMLLGERSTFQDTVLRLCHRLFDPPLILIDRNHRVLAEKQRAEINAQAEIVLEPERRDSGPAILAGCKVAANREADCDPRSMTGLPVPKRRGEETLRWLRRRRA